MTDCGDRGFNSTEFNAEGTPLDPLRCGAVYKQEIDRPCGDRFRPKARNRFGDVAWVVSKLGHEGEHTLALVVRHD